VGTTILMSFAAINNPSIHFCSIDVTMQDPRVKNDLTLIKQNKNEN
jgi:hypothetical protein